MVHSPIPATKKSSGTIQAILREAVIPVRTLGIFMISNGSPMTEVTQLVNMVGLYILIMED